MIKRVFLSLALVAAALPAHAQVKQTGTVTAGHAARWVAPGVIGDAGPASGSRVSGSGYLTEIGITNTGTPLCINDDLITSVSGYHQFCWGANANSNGALISYNAYGGASALGLTINLNGVDYPFPGAGNGNAVMPTSPTIDVNHILQANGGTTISDSGMASDTGGRLRVPYDAASGSGNDEQLSVRLSVTDTLTKPRYGVLGIVKFYPSSGAPWSSTIEGLIGLAYMQGAGTHSGFIFGVGGTAFLCEPSIGDCLAATVATSTGVLAGIYGSAENNGAGNANVLASVWADGADNLIGAGGTATHNTAIYVTSPTVGTIKKGIWFAGTNPAYGSIAADQDLVVRVGNVNAAVFQNDAVACGAQIYTTALGGFIQGFGTNCNMQVLGKGTGDVILTGDTGNIYAKPPSGRAFYTQNDGATCATAGTSNNTTGFLMAAVGTDCGLQVGAIGTGSFSVVTGGVAGFIVSPAQLLAYGPSAALTSAFPAIKRSGTTTQFRLADDSDFAPITASAYSAGATAGVSCSGAPTGGFTTVNGIVTAC